MLQPWQSAALAWQQGSRQQALQAQLTGLSACSQCLQRGLAASAESQVPSPAVLAEPRLLVLCSPTPLPSWRPGG